MWWPSKDHRVCNPALHETFPDLISAVINRTGAISHLNVMPITSNPQTPPSGYALFTSFTLPMRKREFKMVPCHIQGHKDNSRWDLS